MRKVRRTDGLGGTVRIRDLDRMLRHIRSAAVDRLGQLLLRQPVLEIVGLPAQPRRVLRRRTGVLLVLEDRGVRCLDALQQRLTLTVRGLREVGEHLGVAVTLTTRVEQEPRDCEPLQDDDDEEVDHAIFVTVMALLALNTTAEPETSDANRSLAVPAVAPATIRPFASTGTSALAVGTPDEMPRGVSSAIESPPVSVPAAAS